MDQSEYDGLQENDLDTEFDGGGSEHKSRLGIRWHQRFGINQGIAGRFRESRVRYVVDCNRSAVNSFIASS